MKYISLLVFIMMFGCSKPTEPGPVSYHCAFPLGPTIDTPNPNVTVTEKYLIIDGENAQIFVPKSLCIAEVQK